MKQIKRGISMFLALCMVFGLMIFPVSAGDTAPTLSLDSKVGLIGEDVYVDLSIANNTAVGVKALNVIVVYNKNVLTCTGFDESTDSDGEDSAWQTFQDYCKANKRTNKKTDGLYESYNAIVNGNYDETVVLPAGYDSATYAAAKVGYAFDTTFANGKSGVEGVWYDGSIGNFAFSVAENATLGDTDLILIVDTFTAGVSGSVTATATNGKITVVKPGVNLSASSVTVDGTNAQSVALSAYSDTGDAINVTSWDVSGTDTTGFSITNGTLTVPASAKAGEYTVSTKDTNVPEGKRSATLTVSRNASAVTTVEVGKKSIAVPTAAAGTATVTFSAAVKDQYGDEMSGQTVTWSVPETTGITIDGTTGEVTATPAAAAGTVEVTATCGDKSGKADLTVTKADAAVTTVEISGGDSALVIPTGSTAATGAYTATVKDQYDVEMSGQTITWSIENNPTGVSISNGTLSVSSTAAAGEITVKATCGDKSGTKTVKLQKIEFTKTTDPTIAATVTYGMKWEEIVTAVGGYTAKVGEDTVTGTYSLKDGDKAPNAGKRTYTILFTDDADTHVYENVVAYTGEVTVAQKSVSPTVEAIVDQTYTGKKLEPNVTVSCGDIELVQGTDYTVSYGTNKDVGTDAGTVTVATKSGSNYTFTELTKKFNITKVTLTPTVASVDGKEYDKKTDATGTLAFTGAVNDEKPTGTGTFVWTSADAGTTTVDVTGIALDAAWSGNYELSVTSLSGITAPDSAKISQKKITEDDFSSLSTDAKTYDPAAAQTQDIMSAVLGESDYEVTYSNNTNAGTASYTVSGKGNYTGTITKSFTINKAEQATLTVTSTSATYGEDLTLTSSGGNGDGAVTYTWKNGTGSATVIGSTLTPAKAGSVTVTATKAASANYKEATSAETTVTIGKAAAPTVSNQEYSLYYADTTEKTLSVADFGMPDDAGNVTISVSGAVTGTYLDTAKVTGDKYALKSGLTKEAAAGQSEEYTVKLTSDNYADATATVKVKIVDINIPWPAAEELNIKESPKYGDTNAEIISGFTTDSVTAVTNKNITGKFSVKNPTAMPDAGTTTVTLVFTPDAGQGVSGTFEQLYTINAVAKRVITMTSASASKTYDGTALTKETVKTEGDGFLSGEGVTYNFTGKQTVVGESDNDFTYTFKNNTKEGNYDITVVKGKLTVSKITTPIVITADSASKTYDGTALTKDTFTYTKNVLVSGDKIVATVEGTVTDAETAANVVKSYKVENTNGDDVTACYTFGESVNGTLTVNKAPLTITAKSYEITYGDEPANDGVTYEGFVGSETESVLTKAVKYTYNYEKNGDVGTYLITPAEATAKNYEIKFVAGQLTVARKNVTLAITAIDDLTYTGKQLTPEITITGAAVVKDTDYTISYGANVNAGENAGSVTITAKPKSNYTFETVTQNFNINQVTLTPSVASVDGKEYDGTTAAAGALALSGAVNNEKPTVTGTFVWTNASAETNKVNVTDIALDAAWSANYVLKSNSLSNVTAPDSSKISKKALTISGVKATDRSYVADNVAVELTGGELVGVLEGETVSFTLGSGTVVSANVGSNKAVTTNIALDGDVDVIANYELTQPKYVTVSIFPANVLIEAKSTEVKEADESASQDVKDVTSALSTGGVNAEDGLKEKAAALAAGTKTIDNAVQEAVKTIDALKNVSAEDINITVEPSLSVSVKDADLSASITVDISAEYQLKAADKNSPAAAVAVGDKQPLEVNTAIELTVPLPSGFASNGDTIGIEHKHGSKEYIYKATVENNKITFTSLYGLSDFTFKKNLKTVASIERKNLGTLYFESLTDAIAEVGNGETIKLDSDLSELQTAAVSRDVTFTIDANGNSESYYEITAANGYTLTKTGNTYKISKVIVSYATSYKVTVSAAKNGKVVSSRNTANDGVDVVLTVTPNSGYKLDKLTVTTVGGKSVSVNKLNDTKYYFEMPSDAVTVSASFVSTADAMSFSDVGENDWYYDAVKYAFDNGLMNGTGEGKFTPNGTTTRAMIWTVLARQTGVDTTGGANWYDVGMKWAVANGTSDGTNPNGNITREQLATMLYRVARSKGKGFTNAWMFLLDYPDANEISSWADEAMHWCVMNGIINGKDGKLVPTGNATRAEVATMLMRFCELMAE